MQKQEHESSNSNQPNQDEMVLIQGCYLPVEAKEILLSLIQDKINFHEMKDYSLKERSGNNDYNSLKRIEELKELRAKVFQLVKDAHQLGLNIKIKSTIEIELIA